MGKHLKRSFKDWRMGHYAIEPHKFKSEYFVLHREEIRCGKRALIVSPQPCYKRSLSDRIKGIHYLPVCLANDLRAANPGIYNFDIVTKRLGHERVLIAAISDVPRRIIRNAFFETIPRVE